MAERHVTERTKGRQTQVRADNWPKRRLTEHCIYLAEQR